MNRAYCGTKLVMTKYFVFAGALALLILVLITQTVSAAQMKRVYRELVDNKQLPVVISYFKKTQVKPLVLTRVGDKFEGAVDRESKLLSSYYQKMVTGKFTDIADLFYTKDGSAERYLSKLKDSPARYKGYSKLTSVHIYDQYGWGPFQIITFQLLGKNGLELSWREAIICTPKKCMLSNAIDTPDRKFKIFGRYANQKTSQISQSKLKVAFQRNRAEVWLPANAGSYAGFKQYPVAISVGFGASLDKVFNLSKVTKKTSSVNGYDLYPMFQLVQSLKLIGKDVEGTDPRKVNSVKLMARINNVLETESLADTKNGYEFNMVSKFTSGQGVVTEWYHPIAATQRMSNWTHLKILVTTIIDDQLLVYFQPQRKMANKALFEPVQLFILRKSGNKKWLVSLESSKGRNAYLFDNQIMNTIQNRYGEKINFMYSRQNDN